MMVDRGEPLWLVTVEDESRLPSTVAVATVSEGRAAAEAFFAAQCRRRRQRRVRLWMLVHSAVASAVAMPRRGAQC